MNSLHIIAGFPCEVWSDNRLPLVILLLAGIISIGVGLWLRQRYSAQIADRYIFYIGATVVVAAILWALIYFNLGCSGRSVFWM